MAETKRDRSAIILLIAAFKLIKALALICIGVGAFRLMGKDLNDTLEHWANSIGIDPHNRYLTRLLAHTLNISREKLKFVGIATFVYAAMFATEGTGLLLGRRWAEYMTILTTSLLLPLEIYEIAHHSNAIKIGTLVLNVLAVIYLIVRVWRVKEKQEPQEESAPIESRAGAAL